jgi:hypothetical protein
MNTLRGSPYRLRAGDRIIVRGSALNKNGWSRPSLIDEKTILNLRSVPERLGKPYVTSKGDGASLNLAWPEAVKKEYGLFYQLFWDEGQGGF